jgi:hypothetical protein
MLKVSTDRYGRAMRWWKWIGLAGLAGVAATGAVIARDERQRRTYSPDEIRARLHQRATGTATDEPESPVQA